LRQTALIQQTQVIIAPLDGLVMTEIIHAAEEYGDRRDITRYAQEKLFYPWSTTKQLVLNRH